MCPVLLLTKNPIAELDFQMQLQHLNYEVFSSSLLLRKINTSNQSPALFSLFSIIIFSETITNSEIEHMAPALLKNKCTIVRKVRIEPSEEQLEKLKNQGVKNWIRAETNLEELREFFSEFEIKPSHEETIQNGNVNFESLSTLSLSKNERSVLEVIYHSEFHKASREKICLSVWKKEKTASQLSQLSSLVKRINKKMLEVFNISEFIRTSWGQGYELSREVLGLFDRFPIIDNLYEKTSNSKT